MIAKMSFAQEYAQGTQRVFDPEETLRRVQPILSKCGITRVLDTTYIDRIGIPTYNATRPEGIILSLSNGKGWTNAAAAASAVMESIEVDHAEYPDISTWRLSTSESMLRVEGLEVIAPKSLICDCLWPQDDYGGFYYTPDLLLDWVAGVELITSKTVFLPASAIYVKPPFMHYFTSNGLASGNTFEEAVLHAICEIVERDAIAKLIGRTKDSPPTGLRRIDLQSIPGHLVKLADCVAAAGIEMFLLSLPSAIDIYTFWTVFHCPGEPGINLGISGGYGTHTNPQIAASRALTEAAQSRLTHIHGAREDLGIDHTNRQLDPAEQIERVAIQSRTFEKFRNIPVWTWDDLLATYPHRAQGLSVARSLDLVLEMLQAAGKGKGKVYVHDLTKPDMGLSVVKVFIPGLKFSAKLI